MTSLAKLTTPALHAGLELPNCGRDGLLTSDIERSGGDDGLNALAGEKFTGRIQCYCAREVAQIICAGENGALTTIHGKGTAGDRGRANGFVEEYGYIVGDWDIRCISPWNSARGHWSVQGTCQ